MKVLMTMTIQDDIDYDDDDFNKKLVRTIIYVNLLPEES